MRLRQVILVSTILILLPDPAESQEPRPRLPAVEPPVRLPAGKPPVAPDGRPQPLRPAVRLSDIRQGPELAIIDVRRVGNGRIRVGEVVPVEVVVRNTGNREATVRAQSRDLSQGTARFANGPEALVEPGETAILQLDLLATGSGFLIGGRGGGALCGELSERTITLLEAPPAVGLPGYRPGNAESSRWLPVRDGNNADNERTVSFRFDCDVFFR